jgi:hypothetical protein
MCAPRVTRRTSIRYSSSCHTHTHVNMLMHVCQEYEYCIDVCRVTHGAHIEHLMLSKKKFFGFPVTVKNSIKVGSLVFLLQI